MAGEANIISKVSIARVKSIVASVMGGVSEAPIDGQQYARQNGAWSVVVGGGGGSGDMILANAQTVTGAKTFNNGTLLMRNVANTFSSQFTNTNTAARTYTLPDFSGNVLVSGGVNLIGATTTFEIPSGVTNRSFEIVNNGNGLFLKTGQGDNLGAAIFGGTDFLENGGFSLDPDNVLGFGAGFLFIDNRSSRKGLEYADDYSANFTSRTLVDKAYVDNHWNRASGAVLTAANTISGAFNIGFTNTAVGIGVAPASITANTRLHIQGSGTGAGTSGCLITNSGGTSNFRVRDDGDLFLGPNEGIVVGTGNSIYRSVTNSFMRVANDGTVGAQVLFYGSTHATKPNHCEIYAGLTSVFNGKLVAAASVTGYASLRLPHGTAPTTPADGDMWTTTAGLFVRINGVTVGPLT